MSILIPVFATIYPFLTYRNLASVDKIIIHHTVGKMTYNDLVIHLKSTHLGYNWVIWPNGDVKILVPPNYRSNGAYGEGVNAINIALVGNYSAEVLPVRMFEALVQTVAVVARDHLGWSSGQLRIIGHGEFGRTLDPSLSYGTECPGKLAEPSLDWLHYRVLQYLIK